MTGSSASAWSRSDCTTRSVGTIATSRSLMSRTVFSSRSVACSIESIPASAATRIPPEPCACVVMRSPALCASATAAAVSSGVYCETSGGAPSPRMPPVEKSLITFAPAATGSRTALRTSSGPSAIRPTSKPWPPVVVTPRPDATTRGPSTNPLSIARPRSMTIVPFALRSRTVVTPARKAARALRKAFRVARASDCRTSTPKFGSPSRVRWQWQLIIPGKAKRPGDATTSVRSPGGVLGMAFRGPTHATSPPSTTIATFHTARTPQEHGNLAYFVWLEEFAQVTQMLRWGPGVHRRGSFFDDPRIDPRRYAKVGSIYSRLRARGVVPYIIQPELFRLEAMDRMHASEAGYAGYYLPSSMSVRIRDLLEQRPWGDVPAYVYAYWAGIDSVAHVSGPQSADHATEAALFDRALERALASRSPGDTLVILTADHGHAFTDPDN